GAVRSPDGCMYPAPSGCDRHADALCLASPAPELARLATVVAPRIAAAASRINSASSAVVALAVRAGTVFPDNSGVLVASGERVRAKAITLTSRKWDSWGYGGKLELLRMSFGRLGAASRDAASRASDHELLS